MTTSTRKHPASRRPAPRQSGPAASRPAAEAAPLKLWVVLSRAYAAVRAHAEADIERRGITTMEFGILEALYHRGPLLLGDLQKKVLVSSGGVTYLVDRLEDKGLVERLACPNDRRARYAALTPAGRSLIGKTFPPHAKAIARAMSGLTRAEQQVATDLVRRLGLAASALPTSSEA